MGSSEISRLWLLVLHVHLDDLDHRPELVLDREIWALPVLLVVRPLDCEELVNANVVGQNNAANKLGEVSIRNLLCEELVDVLCLHLWSSLLMNLDVLQKFSKDCILLIRVLKVDLSLRYKSRRKKFITVFAESMPWQFSPLDLAIGFELAADHRHHRVSFLLVQMCH